MSGEFGEPVGADLDLGAVRRLMGHARRAAFLFGVGRHRLAAREVRAALAVAPDSPELHALLALSLSELGQAREAEQAAAEAIRLQPDSPDGHKAMAVVLLHQDRLDAAEAATRETLRLAPGDPDVHGLLGAACLGREDWRGALAAAEQGLALDPMHAECLNLRALALTGMGHAAAPSADAASAAALARGPDEAATHAIRGLQRLVAGDFVRAAEHLREAMRLDPSSEPVREGLLEALKARNPLYGALLRAELWLARRSRFARTAVGVAGLLMVREATKAQLHVTSNAAALVPAALVVMAWVVVGAASSLFNLTLLLDPFGRLVLRPAERRYAVAVGAALAAALATLTAGALTNRHVLILAALALTFASGSAAAAGRCRAGWRRATITVGAAAAALLAAGAAVLSTTGTQGPALGLAGASGVVGMLGMALAHVLARAPRVA